MFLIFGSQWGKLAVLGLVVEGRKQITKIKKEIRLIHAVRNQTVVSPTGANSQISNYVK